MFFMKTETSVDPEKKIDESREEEEKKSALKATKSVLYKVYR